MAPDQEPQHLPLAGRLLPPQPDEGEVRRSFVPGMSYRERRNAIYDARTPEKWLWLLQGDNPWHGLPAVLYLLRIIRTHERRLVHLARGLGASWDAIGSARGVRRQVVHRRFAPDAPGRGALAAQATPYWR